MEQVITANNGINIYYYPLEHLHSFHLSLYIKAGVMYEAPTENGISHLLEHVVFRNINHLSDGKLYELLDENALSFNACTYREFVLFEICGISSRFSVAVDILSKALGELALPVEEIDIEKKRIKAEIREDSDASSVNSILQRMVWKDTALEKSIIGTCGIIDRISRRSLNDLREKAVTPQNAFFYAAGSFSDSDISYLKSCVDSYAISTGQETRTNIAPVPADFFNRDGTVLLKPEKYCYMKLGFDINNAECPAHIRDVLFSMLFGFESSRMNQELSEKTGLIYSYDARIEEYINISNISVEFGVRRNNFEKALGTVVDLLNNLKTSCGTPDKVISGILLNSELKYDDPEKLSWVMGYERHMLNENFNSISEKNDRYRTVDKNDISTAAARIFTPKNMSMVIKGDRKTTVQAEHIMAQLK